MGGITSIAEQFGDIPEETLAELPDLTENQYAFVMALVGDQLSASDAFRKAYDTSKWSPEAIWVQASRLKAHPKVKLWLDAIRALQLTRGTVTLDSHLQDLEGLSARAEQSGNYGAAVNAKVSQGRAAGLYKEQIEMTGDPADALKEAVGIVHRWAAKHNQGANEEEIEAWLRSEYGLTP